MSDRDRLRRRATRGSAPQQRRESSVQERIKGSTQPTGQFAAMTRALKMPAYGQRVTSASYLGRDANGKAMYRIRITDKYGRTKIATHTWDGSNFGRPQMSARATGGITQPDPQEATSGSGDARLRGTKDRWAAWVSNASSNGTISAKEAADFMGIIRGWDGDAAGLDRQMGIIQNNVPVGGAADLVFEPEGGFDLGLPGGGGGGGGFGGGSLGPQYVAPDRRVVEDYVKGVLVSLVGTIPDEKVNDLVDLYMGDHRKDFDTLDKEIDPGQSVVEAVRSSNEYKTIHQLRPDSEDERAWVAQRRQAAAQGGLTTDEREDFAITQATVGGDTDDVAQAASVAQLQGSGSARGTLLDEKIRGTVQAMFSGVR